MKRVGALLGRLAPVLNRGTVILTLVAVLVLWELAVRVSGVPVYLVPAPSDIWVSMVGHWNSLLIHTRITLLETLAGFGMSVAIGIPLAVSIVYSRLLERILFPILVASQAVPKVALAPILLVGLGYGILPKVVVAFLIAFFPIVVNTVTGLGSVSPDTLKLMSSMGASQFDVFVKVRFPSAIPSMMAGFKVAIALAVVGAIVGEFVGSRSGLGYYMLVATGNFDTPLVFASVVVLTALGIALFYAVTLMEHLLGRWNRGNANGPAGDPASSWAM
jgi:NitT/TauT family transport system permease protein